MNKNILNNKFFVYLFFTIISFLVRYYIFDDRESWYDEWHSIYVANPNFNHAETLNAYYGDKGDSFLTEFYPPLYIFILKYVFLIFGYIDDNGRWLSIITGTLSIPFSIYLANQFLNIKKTFFIGLVLTFNLFLIWQSLEIRAHSLLVFSSIINIILFYKLLDRKNYISLFGYGIFSVLLLSLWPITGAIFFGKTIYIVKKFVINKIFDKKIFFLFFFILLCYLIFNKDYLILNLSRDWHYTQLYSTFFYNYHFRTFFGSPILGAFYLLMFSFLLIKDSKNIIFKNPKENLLIYIVLSSYILTLSYTLLRASIMSPKYVIFILPLIIIWIGIQLVKLKKYYFIKIIFSILTIIFCIFEIANSPIKRPPTEKALKIIKNDNSKYIISAENDVYDNYLTTKKIFVDEKFVLLEENNDGFEENIDIFWFICLNNPRFAIGNIILPDSQKCKDFSPKDTNYIEIKEEKIKDFLLKKFKKKNYLSK